MYEVFDLSDQFFPGAIRVLADSPEDAVKVVCMAFTGKIDEIVFGKYSVGCGSFAAFTIAIE